MTKAEVCGCVSALRSFCLFNLVHCAGAFPHQPSRRLQVGKVWGTKLNTRAQLQYFAANASVGNEDTVQCRYTNAVNVREGRDEYTEYVTNTAALSVSTAVVPQLDL